MKLRNLVCLVLMLAATLAMADDSTTQPSTQPTTMASATTRPGDLTASIHDLAKKIRQMGEDGEKLPKVAYFDLNKPIVEKPADFSLFGQVDQLTLRSLIDRLHHARDDKEIRGVLITLGDPGVNLAQAQEIRDALIQIKRAGKKAFVYADGYDTDTYTIASGATNVCLLSGGEIEMPGVGIETMYLKGLFDKIGVKADYVQIGEYKGADEEFTRTNASDEFRGELNKLMDSLYGEVVEGISLNRNLSQEQVKGIIDESILTAAKAKEDGLVDDLVDQDGLRDLIGKEIGGKVELVKDYDEAEKQEVDLSSPFALFSLLMKKPEETTRPTIGLVFADGVIVDGEGGGGLMGGSTVGSNDIRRAMREAARDANIKAVVIRINSPGGSALASEAMWQSVRRVAKDKPVIISVGNMAASGGYYLACAGDHIFADPSAIVGSIGVVGGKFVTKDLFDKLGLSTESFLRGANADLFSSETPFSDRQRKMVTNWMQQTYEQFTQRVMTTRAGKIKDIDHVARGRVFVASQALDLGMVDEIGGTANAVTYAAEKVKLGAEDYDIRVIPAPKTFADYINGSDEDTVSPIGAKIDLMDSPVLKVMSPTMRSMVAEQVEILQQLQRRPVVLAAPFALRVN